jgi:ABC-type sugar transport system substrate-binding protein
MEERKMISITRRFLLAVTLVCSGVLMAGASYADKIKVAAIYTLPVEQQWISRIHKALNTAAFARRYRVCVL